MNFRKTEAQIGRRWDAYTGMAWERLEAERAEEERARENAYAYDEEPEPPYCPEGCRTSLPMTEFGTCPGCGAPMETPNKPEVTRG